MALTAGKSDRIPWILQLVDTIYFRGCYSSLNATVHTPVDITAVDETGVDQLNVVVITADRRATFHVILQHSTSITTVIS